MKEIEKILKTVSDGLKLASQGILALAEKVNEAAKAMGKSEESAAKAAARALKPQTKTQRGPKAAAGPRKAGRKKGAADQSMTAIDTVFEVLQKSGTPVDTAALRERTGFDSKKISNILFKLKKRGRIKSAGKGLYVPSK